MESHINDKCALSVLTCNDCKENVFRNVMDKHKTELCTERICECPYGKYGCDEKRKVKELEVHLAKSEVQHLKLQVML